MERHGETRFEVLGPLRVLRDGRELELGPAKQRAVLGMLLLFANRSVAREEIIEAVWGARPPASVANAVQQYVARLRRVLGEGAGITWANGGYVLRAEPSRVDLLLFREHIRSGRSTLDRLADALDLRRGACLSDLPALRSHPSVIAVDQEWRRTVLEAADLAIREARHKPILPYLRRVVAEDPLDEAAYARLIVLLAGAGHQVEALRGYEAIRDRLDAELGVSPGPELRAAHQRVLRQDFGGVEGPVPRQLPAGVPDFTGRDDQLARLDALVAEDDPDAEQGVRVLAIVGEPGVGKTALALNWAHRVASQFPGGQLYLNLHGHGAEAALTAEQAVRRFLRALGVATEQIPRPVEEQAALYRSLLAGRRVLVVLDDAASVEQLRPLLPGAATCAVVITSRNRLPGLIARNGARMLILERMAPQESATLLARVLGDARASAEPAAMAELATACAHLPLALRVAAANLAGRPYDPVARFVAELSDGDALSKLAVGADPEASVRAAFDLSYQRLRPAARDLLRLVGLIPGVHFEQGALAALAGPGDVSASLSELTCAHLLEEQENRRFRIHDLLRQYAREKGRAEDARADVAAAVRRLHRWYLRKVAAAARLLYPEMVRLPRCTDGADEVAPDGFDDHREALAWLDAEHVNLLAMIEHTPTASRRTSGVDGVGSEEGSAADRPDGATAWLLADGLRGYFWQRHSGLDWLNAAEAGMRRAEADGDVLAQAAMLLSRGGAYHCLDRYPEAIEQSAAAAATAERAAWPEGTAAAHGQLGCVYADMGDLRAAAESHNRALELYRRLERPAQCAVTLANLGEVHRQLGQLERASRHLTEAQSLYRDLGSPDGEAQALANLGEVENALGRYADAQDHLGAAVTLCREIGNRYGETEALFGLAKVHRDTGRLDEAVERGEEALTMARLIRSRRSEASARGVLGTVHLCRGRADRAGQLCREALGLARATGARYIEAFALIGLAASQDADGLPLASEAVELARAAGFRVLEGQAFVTAARARLLTGDLDGALADARAALRLHRTTGYRIGETHTRRLLGDIRRQTKRLSV